MLCSYNSSPHYIIQSTPFHPFRTFVYNLVRFEIQQEQQQHKRNRTGKWQASYMQVLVYFRGSFRALTAAPQEYSLQDKEQGTRCKQKLVIPENPPSPVSDNLYVVSHNPLFNVHNLMHSHKEILIFA
ncbi:unnamed protein product [Orchesella dallaii]|uniref:Uncharacterized protein n=1 Tax=Orchesella dallaii TaxID=48710 RepID=A0ABP1QSJ5_9HEXA